VIEHDRLPRHRLRVWFACLFMLFALPALAQNVVQQENAKTVGVTSQWFISDANYAANREIEGYASATSVNRGGAISLYVQTSDPSYTIDVYRVGWYGGVGGRQVAGPITRTRTAQPACPMTDTATRLVECAWTNPYVLNVPGTADPTDWASGVYLAKLTGSNSGKQSYIVFAVRDDARPAGVMFQNSVTTWAAYNNFGGFNFYDSDSGGTPANKVSFNRPYWNGQRHLNGKGAGDFLSWEINMLRFLEREGYDVKYATNIDTHTTPSGLLNVRSFLSVGHDEYYTKQMYDAVEAARNAGVHLGFFGANNIYWQIRLEPSASGQANRTVVGYKYDFDPIQSTNPSLATYLWRETVRAPINRPEAALIGIMYDFNTVDLDVVIADCSSWVCAGTNLQPGDRLPGMLGYEVDKLAPSSPPNITVIAASPYDACLNPQCSATERRLANVTHYTAASGAIVFATGSMQWNWGLDAFSLLPDAGKDDQHGDRSNPAVQRMTRNVLDRFTALAGNNPPAIISSPVTSARVSVPYSYTVRASDPNGDAVSYSLTQAPAGMTIQAATGLVSWLPSAGQVGGHAVSVRASDPGGLFVTQAFTVTVTTNAAPTFTSTPVVTARVGTAYAYTARATDPDGDALSYSLTLAPAGMTINAISGAIAWTPTVAQVGTQEVTIRAADPGGLVATQSYTITVATANVAPRILSAPITGAGVGVAYSYPVVAVDDNGDTLRYTLTRAPSRMTINSTTGVISWTPTASQVGNRGVTVRATDPSGLFVSQAFTVVVVAGNGPPQITSSPVTSATIGVPYAYDVNANDPNGDAITYALSRAPAGMAINASTGLIAWTPASTQGGAQAVIVRVTDARGLASSQSFTVTVAGAVTGAPQFTSAPVTTATAGLPYAYAARATDPEGEAVLYSLMQAPAGMGINGTTGAIGWTPTTAQVGAHPVTVRAADPGGLAGTQSFTVTVAAANAPPQITTTPSTAATVGAGYVYAPAATDPNGDVLAWSLTQAPAGMTINAGTGAVAWTPTAAQVGSQPVTVRVVDPGGLAATQSYTITVGGAVNQAPSITSAPVTTASVGVAYTYSARASDPNGDTLTWSLTQAPAGMSVNAATGIVSWTPSSTQAGSHPVTVRAADPGGLAASQAYTITVGGGPAPANTRVDAASPATYTAVRGASVVITLNWYRVRMPTDYMQFMHLVGPGGQMASVDDHWTTSSTWTTAPFTEARTIVVPASLAPGTYDIRVGLSGGNPWIDVPLLMGTGITDPDGDNRYRVGTLTVQ